MATGRRRSLEQTRVLRSYLTIEVGEQAGAIATGCHPINPPEITTDPATGGIHATVPFIAPTFDP